MKKIVKLTESDLTRIVKRVINENMGDDMRGRGDYMKLPDCKVGEQGQLVQHGTLFALNKDNRTFCKIISNPS
jgi:hypothetical protein